MGTANSQAQLDWNTSQAIAKAQADAQMAAAAAKQAGANNLLKLGGSLFSAATPGAGGVSALGNIYGGVQGGVNGMLSYMQPNAGGPVNGYPNNDPYGSYYAQG
jgi:hypothetical protein